MDMIDPVIVVCFSENMDLALDTNFTLMVKHGAHRLVSVLERGLYRLALKLKCESSQVAFMFIRDPEVCVLKSSTTIAFGIEREPCVEFVEVRHLCLS